MTNGDGRSSNVSLLFPFQFSLTVLPSASLSLNVGLGKGAPFPLPYLCWLLKFYLVLSLGRKWGGASMAFKSHDMLPLLLISFLQMMLCFFAEPMQGKCALLTTISENLQPGLDKSSITTSLFFTSATICLRSAGHSLHCWSRKGGSIWAYRSFTEIQNAGVPEVQEKVVKRLAGLKARSLSQAGRTVLFFLGGWVGLQLTMKFCTFRSSVSLFSHGSFPSLYCWPRFNDIR